MRLYYLHRAAAVVSVGCALALQGACGGGVKDVRAWQLHGDSDRPGLSNIAVERFGKCMTDYVSQLPSQQNEVRVVVEVDEDRNREVTIEGLPDTAYDFGACMRIAMRDMSINEELFRNGVKELHQKREQASAEQRKFVGNPIVIVVAGVTIVVSEVIVEAGLYTVMVGVTVKVVDKAVADVADLAKSGARGRNTCTAGYVKCIMSGGSPFLGNNWGISRCATCQSVCENRTPKSWPSTVEIAGVGTVSCY